MSLSKAFFVVKESTLPNSGKGLFVTTDIPKGTLIIEYTGRITTWKEVENDAANGYIYFKNRNYVIDAKRHLSSLARYANDATGLSKIKGVKNNAQYKVSGGKVFIESTRDIKAGDEILVSYGADYWNTVRENMAIDKAGARQKNK